MFLSFFDKFVLIFDKKKGGCHVELNWKTDFQFAKVNPCS